MLTVPLLLLCALAMSKRERAGAEAAVCSSAISASPPETCILENWVRRAVSAADIAFTKGTGMTIEM